MQKAYLSLNDGGSIILNGSVASVKGTAAFGIYGATKAALRSFVRTWTSDLKDRHIRSNVISPGPTDTPVIEGQPADAIARIVSTIPMGRMGNPDEIAKAALFLASDDSSFVTGIELFVDGGRRDSMIGISLNAIGLLLRSAFELSRWRGGRYAWSAAPHVLTADSVWVTRRSL